MTWSLNAGGVMEHFLKRHFQLMTKAFLLTAILASYPGGENALNRRLKCPFNCLVMPAAAAG